MLKATYPASFSELPSCRGSWARRELSRAALGGQLWSSVPCSQSTGLRASDPQSEPDPSATCSARACLLPSPFPELEGRPPHLLPSQAWPRLKPGLTQQQAGEETWPPVSLTQPGTGNASASFKGFVAKGRKPLEVGPQGRPRPSRGWNK